MEPTKPQNNDLGANPKNGMSGVTSSSADVERRNMSEDKERLSEHKERLAYDFREMMSSAEALLRSTAKYTGAEVEEARNRLQQQVSAARDRSSEMNDSMREMKQRFASRTDECVHKHPWTCIGIAFVTGMVTAHCMRR